MHGEKNAKSFLGFSSRYKPLKNDGEGEGRRGYIAAAHAREEIPNGIVVTHASGNVNGMVEGGRGMGVASRGTVIKEMEEEEGLRAMIPKPLEDAVDES